MTKFEQDGVEFAFVRYGLPIPGEFFLQGGYLVAEKAGFVKIGTIKKNKKTYSYILEKSLK